MKLAILLPGYLDSPDYRHMISFERGLKKLGYDVVRLDSCGLWESGDVSKYTLTNYLAQIKQTVESFKNKNPQDILLLGHSMGGFMSIIAGKRIPEVTTIVSLCSPADRKGSAESWKGKDLRISDRDLSSDQGKKRTFSIPKSFAKMPFNTLQRKMLKVSIYLL